MTDDQCVAIVAAIMLSTVPMSYTATAEEALKLFRETQRVCREQRKSDANADPYFA